MNSLDSVTKIVTQYFSAVTRETFTYKAKVYRPKDLRVSPNIFYRTMICHPNCGGCCKKLTVDFLPGDPLHELVGPHVKVVIIPFNGREVTIIRDDQEGQKGFFCRYLRMEDARCSIHGKHPFSCDFELLRFSMMSDDLRPNQLAHRPFGRGWNMRRIDGERGAKCEWGTVDPTYQADVHRKLSRLRQWTDHFGIETCLPEVLDWVQSGPHNDPLIARNT